MRDDYLWDGSGEPDPEVQRLERLLSEFRSDRPAPELPAGKRFVGVRPRWAAIAAGLLVAVAGTWLITRGTTESWQVARDGALQGRLAVGETLETGASRATVSASGIGVLQVEPNSRLRLISAHGIDQRLSLERGTIHARIWARPRSLVVDTPSAVATDLGCRYTLQVGDDGSGLVTVQSGWVSFARDGREVFIPAGAACQTRPRGGPGTPYREQAPLEFREAVRELDSGRGGDAALAVVLADATREDAFTLWHLLTRTDSGEANRVYEALAAMAAPPIGVTREGVLRRDRAMLDAWWDSLGLGDTSWWRQLRARG